MNIDIIHSDCLAGLREMKADTIQLVVTSPPYFNVKDYAQWETYEEYLDFLKEVFTEVFRVLEEGRVIAVNVSPILIPRKSRQFASQRLNLPMHLSIILEDIGFSFLEDIQWVKPNGAVKNRNGNFYMTRKPLTYKPNTVNEYVLVYQKPMKDNRPIDKILRRYEENIVKESAILGDYEKTNVWHISPVKSKEHPAPFPQDLTDRLIRFYSFKGDTVVDMFLGSGTTALSCKDLSRNFRGFEYKREYVDLALRRLNEPVRKL